MYYQKLTVETSTLNLPEIDVYFVIFYKIVKIYALVFHHDLLRAN